MVIFLCATRYFKAVLIQQPKVIKTMKHKSIAYLSRQVIHILCLHLSIVFLLKALITKRTLSHQKSLLLLMLRLLRNHLLRCCTSSAIACYYLFPVSQILSGMPVTFGLFYLIFWTQCSVSLSVISPKQVPTLKAIYNAVILSLVLDLNLRLFPFSDSFSSFINLLMYCTNF